MLINWEIMQVWGQRAYRERAYRESLYLPLSFAVDLKLLLKSKNFIFKKEKLKKRNYLSISEFVLISSVDYEGNFSKQLSCLHLLILSQG